MDNPMVRGAALLERWEAPDVATLLAKRSRLPTRARISFFQGRAGVVRSTPHDVFLRRAGAFAGRMAEGGVRSGDRVVLLCPQPEAALTAYTAAVVLGAIPLVHAVRPGFDDAAKVTLGLRDVVAALGARTHVVAQARDGRPVVATEAHHLPLDLDDLPADPGTAAFPFCPPPSVDQVLHLQATSGSTGRPRYVALTHGNILANCSSALDRMGFDEHERVVSWLPLFHDLGLVGMALNALLGGLDLTLLSPFDFLKDPACWLDALTAQQGTMTASPNFGFDQVMRRVPDERLRSVDLSSCRRMYCGGEPIDAFTIARFGERFTSFGLPPDAVRPTYGLAEATLLVSMPPLDEPARFVTVPVEEVARLDRVTVTAEGPIPALPDRVEGHVAAVVSVGPAALGLSVALLDAAGNAIVDQDRCGEIVVRGPSVSPGYWNADGTLDRTDASGLRTGDVGFFHGNDLFVVERMKNTIIRNGHNYSPAVLEAELARVLQRPLAEVLVLDADLRPGHGRVTAVIGVGRGDDHTAIEQLVKQTSRSLEPPIEELVLVPRGALPRTTSGKKQHHLVRSMMQLGRFEQAERRTLLSVDDPEPCETVIDLDEVDTRHTVIRLIGEQAARRGVVATVTDSLDLASDLGLDSLAVYELAVTIEAALALTVPDEELASVRSVGDLVALVDRCRRAPGERGAGSTGRLGAIADLVPQAYAEVAEQRDRQLLVGDRWISDFASLNYLGLDLDARVIDAVRPAIERWGLHPGWTRAVASPAPYSQLEDALAALVGAPDVVVFPTITLLHFGVLPKLAGAAGTILVDQGSHSSILEATELARARGSTVVPVRRSDPEDLEAKLRATRGDGPRIVTVNGVYSMSGNLPDLRSYVEVAARYGATLYVDDAHGIGVLGENPHTAQPLGFGGGGVVRHLGLTYDHIVYVGGLSKAFSSMGAFVTCRSAAERAVIDHASTVLFSGPLPIASLATALAGLWVNTIDGDERRERLWWLTSRLITGARRLGFAIDNDMGFPCVTPIVGDLERTIRACQILWDHRILITPAVFPAMPLDRGGIRISVTAANTFGEVEQLLTALEAVRDELGPTPDRIARGAVRSGLFEA